MPADLKQLLSYCKGLSITTAHHISIISPQGFACMEKKKIFVIQKRNVHPNQHALTVNNKSIAEPIAVHCDFLLSLSLSILLFLLPSSTKARESHVTSFFQLSHSLMIIHQRSLLTHKQKILSKIDLRNYYYAPMEFSAMFTFQLQINTKRSTLPSPHCRNGICRSLGAMFKLHKCSDILV